MAQAVDAVTHDKTHGPGVVVRPDGFTAVTLFGLKKTFSNFVEGIVPADRRELAVSFAAGAAQRLGQAVRMMNTFVVAGDLAADNSSGIGIFRGASNLSYRVVINLFDFQRTGRRAVVRAGAVVRHESGARGSMGS